MITITTKREISNERAASLLITAFEGGANYWYHDLHLGKTPKGKGKADFGCWYGEAPLEGGSVRFSVQGGVPSGYPQPNSGGCYTLSLSKVKRGLKIMSEKHPGHWTDFIMQREDTLTADVFLQCCVFGDVIYG